MTPNPICSWGRSVVALAAAVVAFAGATPWSNAQVDAALDVPAVETDAAINTGAAPATTTTASTQPATVLTASSPLPASAPVRADAGEIAESADWSQSLKHLASVLAGKDLVALVKLLSSDPAPTIKLFSSDALQSPARLLGMTTGSKILGVHAYDKPPGTLATDLADDFSAAGDAVPQTVRDGMVPTDAAAAKKANDTAGQWIQQVLLPEKDDVVGVIVLWPSTPGRAEAAAPTRAVFVLVKASPVEGGYAFRQITFGDPLETPR